jgi:hypothetical protein
MAVRRRGRHGCHRRRSARLQHAWLQLHYRVFVFFFFFVVLLIFAAAAAAAAGVLNVCLFGLCLF